MRPQPGDADDDEIDGNDVIQQARHEENENAGQQGDDRLQQRDVQHHGNELLSVLNPIRTRPAVARPHGRAGGSSWPAPGAAWSAGCGWGAACAGRAAAACGWAGAAGCASGRCAAWTGWPGPGPRLAAALAGCACRAFGARCAAALAPFALCGVGCVAALARFGPSPRAATVPGPVNWPGRLVAAIGGAPWFCRADSVGVERAAVKCCVCADVTGAWESRAATCSVAVGRAAMPPRPPLKLTRAPERALTGAL